MPERWKQVWIPMALAILLASCLQIPADDQTLGTGNSRAVSISLVDKCSSDMLSSTADARSSHLVPLDADGFTLVSWNLFKEDKPGWDADLEDLTAQDGILLLQEARISQELTRIMGARGFNWDLASAFYWRGAPVGVLNAAHATSKMRCMVRTLEPLLRVPKSMLITRYPLTQFKSDLVVANLHALNFTLGTGSYRKLWKDVANTLTPHTGPLIVAGDFNTWSSARMAIVEEIMARLGLIPVTFKDDKRTTFWGQIVDHVYYRGLTQLEANILPVDSSDHHPMIVKFKVSDRS